MILKHLTSLLVFLFAAQCLSAQGIALDSTFGQNGYVKTSLYTSGTSYSAMIDQTPDNHIVVMAGGKNYLTGLLFCKYSMNGDSVQAYNFPNNFLNGVGTSSIKALADGRFVVASYEKGTGLKMISQDGTVDQNFGENGGAPLFYTSIHDIQISQNNRILLAGQNLNTYDGELAGAYVIAYDMQGHLDSSFADNGRFRYHYDWVEFFNKMQQQPDGKILVTGCAMSQTLPSYNTLIRLLPNGALDSTFGVNGLVAERLASGGENFGMTLQPDQKILVCGYDQGLHAAIIIRYLPNGARDAAFGVDGVVTLPMFVEANDLLVLPNGKILAYCVVPGDDDYSALLQLLPDGSLDPYFGTGGVFYNPMPNFSPPLKMKLVDDHKLIVTGTNTTFSNNFIYQKLQLQAYTLDLSVGVVSPQDNAKYWIYPNPVRDHFDIGFELKTKQELQFDLFDLQGKQLQTLVSKSMFETGSHTVPVNLPGGLAAGNYLLRLTSAGKPVATVQLLKM
jgi:uncharacterized delta-60 repeat protein